MAGESVIGALRVVLGADTAALDKGLKDSGGKLQVFADVAKASMAVAVAAVGAAAIAIGSSIKTAIDNADKVNKLSQSTGTTTEEFSKLSYAAQLADVSQESLGKSLGKLSKAMVSAASDAAGPAGLAFQALGINVKNADGSLKDSSSVISEVAGKFEGYQDGAAKSALAIALFGKTGAEMIPVLNLGKQGLSDSADEAEKFGLVLDKKTTMAAEAFNDNLKKMDLIKQGLVTTITAKMLPAFEQFSEQLLEAKQNSALMTQAADGIVTIIKGIVSVAVQATVAFQRLIAETGAFAAAYKAAGGGLAGLSAGWTAMNEEGKTTEAVMADMSASLSNLWKDAPTFSWTSQLNDIRAMNKEVLAIAGEWGKVPAPIIASENATKSALQAYLDSQAKRTAGQAAEAATIGKSVGEQAKLRVEYEAQAIALAKNIALGPTQLAQIQAAGDAAAMAAMKVAGANATVQAQNPAQQFQAQMTQLQQLYDAGVISLETFGARQQQIAEQAGATWAIASASIAGSFATIANSFGKESSAMATAAKVFGVIQGTISMYTGAAKALELPFPANIAAMAAVLAKGASLVASIKSQSIPTGYMTGGSFTVGGSGGPDSTPVSFMASPGEQVDIWRPDQGGGADPRRGSGNPQIVNLAVPFATTFDVLRELIDRLNAMGRDGYRLNVVPA